VHLFCVETVLQSAGPTFPAEEIRRACWITLGVTVYVLVCHIWFDWDAKAFRLNLLRNRRKQAARFSHGETAAWADLEKEAQWVVDEVMAKLPPEILAEAEKVPLIFDEKRKTEDGRVLLGLYRGFTEGLVSDRKGPIVLYLRNIAESCAERGEDFRDEVRTTYLQELGHHFGWSETEVEERGL
jgi:predicted Zn-dependent protease with MMP-like domain